MDQMSWLAGGVFWSLGILVIGLLLSSKLNVILSPAEQGKSQRCWMWIILKYAAAAAVVLLLIWFICYE